MLDIVFDLYGQFTSRHQNQGPETLGMPLALPTQGFQYRQDKTDGFASAVLLGSNNVAFPQKGRDRFALDLGGVV